MLIGRVDIPVRLNEEGRNYILLEDIQDPAFKRGLREYSEQLLEVFHVGSKEAISLQILLDYESARDRGKKAVA